MSLELNNGKYTKLLEWIPINKVDWKGLCDNPNAIHLLEKNLDKVKWYFLSSNPNAMPILEKNMDKVHWKMLTENPNIFTTYS